MNRTIVIASNNEKKAREMRGLLPDTLCVLTAGQANITMPDETGLTFEDNALLKARAAARQSGYVCVADDSGLEVDALDGAPGVRSARFAGDYGRPESDKENNKLLLELLGPVAENGRSARFVSAVAVVGPDGKESIVRGTVEGKLAHEPRGENGFGYDPLFIPLGQSLTFAELSDDEKNELSHRGQAFRAAVPEILKLMCC
jgi:XTP/dITP diphosphohydrolase